MGALRAKDSSKKVRIPADLCIWEAGKEEFDVAALRTIGRAAR
jgi:hypothetical protein